MSILSLHSVTKGFGQNAVALHQVELEVQPGELLALTGESGCGKTTLLRLIAGLEKPDHGTIVIQGQTVSTSGMIVPPQKRSVGLVFQDYALFPHMTVSRNIAYGLKGGASDRHDRIDELLKMVNLKGLNDRYPHQLSGGQQQRVAIARALAPRPKILLLDEPFSNLDTTLKDRVRSEISEILKRSGTTVILVTHDVQDALSMADRIAVLKQGKLLQVDHPQELYKKPVDSYTASFFGKVNLVPVSSPEGKLISDLDDFPKGFGTKLSGTWCLRPEHIHITSPNRAGLEAVITSIDYMGGYQQLQVRIGNVYLWCHQGSGKLFEIGQKVTLHIDLDQIHFIKN